MLAVSVIAVGEDGKRELVFMARGYMVCLVSGVRCSMSGHASGSMASCKWREEKVRKR